MFDVEIVDDIITKSELEWKNRRCMGIEDDDDDDDKEKRYSMQHMPTNPVRKV